MSVFSLPRLHFAGLATTQLPTGPRQGLTDLATNGALCADGTPFPPGRPPAEYDGPRGEHFAGNGHFAVPSAAITGVELRAGEVDTADPVVGRQVDLWGHYNEYLQTTVNRGRVFDVDPASNWTTTVMVGQFGFGRAGRSHDTGYALVGDVHGYQPPRWQDLRRGTVVHQFAVAREEIAWPAPVAGSEAVAALARALAGSDGLVVQFALLAPDGPRLPDAPRSWELRGTIAPWWRAEPRTFPAGRLMLPVEPGVRVFSVDVGAEYVTLNLVTAAASLPPGEVELRTARTGKLVAAVPVRSCRESARHGGLVCATRLGEAEDEALVLVAARDGRVLAREQEVVLQADDACQVLDHPRHAGDDSCDAEVGFRSFVRGRPAPVAVVRVRQFPNPRALPLAPDAATAEIVHVADPERTGPESTDTLSTDTLSTDTLSTDTLSIDPPSIDTVSTDAGGFGRLTLRGLRPGSTRLLLGGDATGVHYDNDDELGFWAGAGGVHVRVLPDDWRLADLRDDEVTFETVYREVFAPYEAQYSFMREEVFSLADRCKVETYAKLVWQMCDPRNKATTYYMPPTRDLTAPKAALLLRYLRRVQRPDHVLLRAETPAARPGLATRAELVAALRDAVKLELAVMIQYLYAAYTVPDHGAGREYVRRGDWTPEQLALACGDGGETLAGGIRGTLIRVAREEMIHFLLANNILMAIGEPFHLPHLDFGTLNAELPIALDFSLERLDVASVARFVRIEEPDGLVTPVRLGTRTSTGTSTSADADADADGDGGEPGYASISELYGDIRRALTTIPGLFLTEPGRGGGEHHLFLRKRVNDHHPDYQLEVDDLASALFAIDVITEQGEGGELTDGDEPSEESHHAAFLGVAEALRRSDWVPSYPAARNPTLRRGDRARQYIPDPDARRVMRLFNAAYAVALQLMVQHFGAGPDTSLRRSKLMNAAIDVMTGVLRPLGELLTTMPSGLRGRTAGPSFELDAPPAFIARPDVAALRVARQLDDVAAAASACPPVPARVAEISTLLAEQLRGSVR
ncbi:ferritin-like domain-containing protein [Nonomuraea longicatena]|uniref:Chromopyrrolic acid synthase n=1 Tax=Nonomuraea longicatena TaxID=83682 RepID=Q27IF3_9ACTN|nr:InkD [Nonomuraea longicatena]ACN29720.1 chromopyrrolic acid synthase [Nonomuraea longicatena]